MGEAKAAEIKWEYACALWTKQTVSCRVVASLLGRCVLGIWLPLLQQCIIVAAHCRLRCTNASRKRFKRGWWICCLNTPTACSAAWVLYDLTRQSPWLFKAVVILLTIHRAVPLETISVCPNGPNDSSVQKSLILFLPSLVISVSLHKCHWLILET